jgi:oligopeptide transport system permease protein
MLKIILRRLLEAVPVLLVIVTMTFFFVRLAPGGPFAEEKNVPAQIRARLEAHYHLDSPLWKQYLDYLGGLVHGDLGPSFKEATYSVNELILLSLPVSLELGLYALIVALAVGLTAGIVAALRPNSATDYAPMSLAMLGICVPNFVLGPILALIFGIWLGWLPVSGWDPLFEVTLGAKTEFHLRWETLADTQKVLPSITLGLAYAAYIARLARGGMLEILSQDFIRTARAKGLSEIRVVLRHALRGGIAPVVSFLGPAAAGLLTGSFVVETIFQIPGLGRRFVNSAFDRDYTMIMGTVLTYATLIILFNLIVDLVHLWLDPRLRDA